MRISFIGYTKEQPFDFFCLGDKILIESMQKIRNDKMSMTHWTDIGPDLTSTRVYDLNRNKYSNGDLKNSDLFVILEIPDENSPNADKSEVYKLLDKIKRTQIPSINPVQTFLDYSDKSYLWKNPSIPFPKTHMITSNSDLEVILSDFDEEIMLKPLDGDGGKGVIKIQNNFLKVRETISHSNIPYLIQEYLPEITEGEKSLFFFNKKFKYAVLKKPREGEFKCNEDSCQSITRYYPKAEEIEITRNALLAMDAPSLLERVDMTSSGKIIEMTIDCPGFFVTYAKVQSEIGKWFYELVDAVSPRKR